MTIFQTVKQELTLSDDVINYVNSTTTKSDKIRFLHSQGFKRGTIAQILGISYQHVRNTLVRPLKKSK